jgi:hypothetical protein
MENTIKENLALKIILLRDKEKKGEITFNEMLKEAVKLIAEYESKYFICL